MKANFMLMASYNQWMNKQMFAAMSQLSDEQQNQQCGAFFGTLIGTMNHIVVADIIWLNRFSAHPRTFSALENIRDFPSPQALSEVLYSQQDTLWHAREKLDDIICAFTDEVEEGDYEQPLGYTNTRGLRFSKKFGFVVQHFFNHQTHHRGQATTLLSQFGVDVGVTDLLNVIPDSL